MYMRKYRAEFEVETWDSPPVYRGEITFESIWNNDSRVADLAFEHAVSRAMADGKYRKIRSIRVKKWEMISEEKIA